MALVHLAILQLTLLCVVEASIVNTNTMPLAKDGCEDHCGNVSIPYPFGTREGCYINDGFLITCDHTYNPPLAFLREGNISLTDIWLWGEMRIYAFVANDCYNETGGSVYKNHPWIGLVNFQISNTRNKFMTIGCDTYAVIEGSRGTNYETGCMSLCDSTNDVVEGSCSGIGCCETAIPRGVLGFNIIVSSYYNHTRVWGFNPCSYAFVAEEGTYNFSTQDLQIFMGDHKMPMVLNWAIGDQNCSEAKKGLESYVCMANSECHDSNNGPGYRCSCSKGYQGNPYLKDGCQGCHFTWNYC